MKQLSKAIMTWGSKSCHGLSYDLAKRNPYDRNKGSKPPCVFLYSHRREHRSVALIIQSPHVRWRLQRSVESHFSKKNHNAIAAACDTHRASHFQDIPSALSTKKDKSFVLITVTCLKSGRSLVHKTNPNHSEYSIQPSTLFPALQSRFPGIQKTSYEGMQTYGIEMTITFVECWN